MAISGQNSCLFTVVVMVSPLAGPTARCRLDTHWTRGPQNESAPDLFSQVRGCFVLVGDTGFETGFTDASPDALNCTDTLLTCVDVPLLTDTGGHQLP